jgi:hypothetical protein
MALNEEDQTEVAFKSIRADVDPVSGNEVPPGSLPEEVRDDIPVMLSEGEYVVPADVLRYYGVKFFEDLRTMAKVGLADMEANGRIGGEPIEEQGELPFTDDELLAEEDAMEPEDEQMSAAFGGLVGFAPGGLNMPEGTQVGTTGSAGFAQDPNDPTQVVMGSALSSTGYELVTFYGPGGLNDKVNIPFFNGMALAAIPPNYTKDAPQETELEKATSEDSSEGFAEKAKISFEKDKEPTDYSNPDEARKAVENYYATQSHPGIIGLLAKAFNSKDEILSGIDSALGNTEPDSEKAKELADVRKTLEDKSLYKEEKQEKGFADTFLGDLLGFDGNFGLSDKRKGKSTQPDYSSKLKYLKGDAPEGLSWLGNERDSYNAAVRTGNDRVVQHYDIINEAREAQEAYKKGKSTGNVMLSKETIERLDKEIADAEDKDKKE